MNESNEREGGETLYQGELVESQGGTDVQHTKTIVLITITLI